MCHSVTKLKQGTQFTVTSSMFYFILSFIRNRCLLMDQTVGEKTFKSPLVTEDIYFISTTYITAASLGPHFDPSRWTQ